MSSDPESGTENRNKKVQRIENNAARIEEKIDLSSSLVREVSKLLHPLATSSPLSRSHGEINELKMLLHNQDYQPARRSAVFLRPLPANDYFSKPTFSSFYRRHHGNYNPFSALSQQHCDHCSWAPLCRSRSEPFPFNLDQRTSPSDKNSSNSDKEGVPSILKTKEIPLSTTKEINVYHSGGVLIMQQIKEPTSDNENLRLSEISSKLIEDCQKLSQDFKEIDGKSEGKVVQFHLTPDDSLESKNYFDCSPSKDATGSLKSRGLEQPSSLSTNESLPPFGPSSPSSTASARRLEWDSGADVGYVNRDASKPTLSAIEKMTLQGIAMQSVSKKAVNKARRRVFEPIPLDLYELDENRPLTKDSGTNPDRDCEETGNICAHASEEAEKTLQDTGTETNEISPVNASNQSLTNSTDVKDESTFVNTLGAEYDFPRPPPFHHTKSSPKQRRKKASPKLKKRIQKIIELARSGNNSECESRVDELVVDHSFRGEFVAQNIGKCGLTSASSGSNITVLSQSETKVKLVDKLVQTSDRSRESKGIQAVEKVSPKLMSCKNIQASGELNSLPKHLDGMKNSAMTGREVRTKGSQFFGEGANSLPKALDKANRINKKGIELMVYVAHIKENQVKQPEPVAGSSGVNKSCKGKNAIKADRGKAPKADDLNLSEDLNKKHGLKSSKTSTGKKSHDKSDKSGELTVESLRQRDDTVDPSIMQNKYFDSQKNDVRRSTQLEGDVLHTKEFATVGIQYSPRNEVQANRKLEGTAGRDFWTDTLDSQASSTQTAHSWVHEGGPRRNSVVRPTRSFEYLPGEVYESSGNLRETLPSETSQNVITESSSSESEPPPVDYPSEGAVVPENMVEENEAVSDGTRHGDGDGGDVGGGTVVLENSDSNEGQVSGGAWLVVSNDCLTVDVTRQGLTDAEGVSEESPKSSLTESLRRKIASIAVQTEAHNATKDGSHRDDSLKRLIRDLCEILLNDRRSLRGGFRSLDRSSLLSSRERTLQSSNVSGIKSSEGSTSRKLKDGCYKETVKRVTDYNDEPNNSKHKIKAGMQSVNQVITDITDSRHGGNRKKVVNPVAEKNKKVELLRALGNANNDLVETVASGYSPDGDNHEPSSTASTAEKSQHSSQMNGLNEKSIDEKKNCRCHLEVPSVRKTNKDTTKKEERVLSSQSSNERSSENNSSSVQMHQNRACSTPSTQTSNDEKLKVTTSNGTKTYSSCPSASGETSASNGDCNEKSQESSKGDLSKERNEALYRKDYMRKSYAKGAGANTQFECRTAHQAIEICDNRRLVPSFSPEFNDKATQLSGSSLCYCRKCRSDSCTCLQQADVATQVSKSSSNTTTTEVSPSVKADSPTYCQKCRNESCVCLKGVIDIGTQMSGRSRECCYCKQLKCTCEEISPNIDESSTGKCQNCGNESCTCLLLVLSPPAAEANSLSTKTSRRCGKCNKYGCSCTNNRTSGAAEGRSLRVINGHHFEGNIEVDASSSESSSLSNDRPRNSNKKRAQHGKADEKETCTVCLCPEGIKQQCIFCPCHIDKNMHIPRCDCHEQAVPKFLLPGFCKCHQRNLEYFNECSCSDVISSPNCPCCENFYRHMRKSIYEQQMKEIMPTKAQKTNKISPKNYFLKLEETEVSKDSSDVSEPEKKPLEVITIKIPVKRCGKAKLPSKHFYYAQDSQDDSSKRKEKDVEYLDDIIKKYTTKLSSDDASEGSNGHSEPNRASSGNSFKTLQEWLESNRPDFLNSAETRRNVIRERVKERENNKENRVQRVIKTCPVQHGACPLPTRIFTSAQMKQQTLRKYKQLFEVRKRKEDRKKSEEHRRNKLMADIFAKKLQLKTLRGQTVREYEDCSCHIRAENGSTFLYGIFDGNDGIQAANFALQRMAAEILLLSELVDKNSDEEVKEVLRQAFIAVEKIYWDSLDDKLAVRTSVQCEIPDGLTPFEAYQKYPHLVDRLKTLNLELQCGTTAVIALIHLGRLYVANVGDSRALLCKTDSDGVLKVIQLSVDHDLRNEDEQLRLSNLGLQLDKIRQASRIGNQECTRCIGNYLVKGGYKDLEELSNARSEPVIAEPDIHGGIPLDESCRFLLLMSDGLYKSLQVATGSPDSVNKDIAQMTVEQFREQATLTGVAQAVVDKVARYHHDLFMKDGSPPGRDDITLIVRNFNYPMNMALASPVTPLASQVRFNPVVATAAIEADEVNDESDNVSTGVDTRSTEGTTTTTTSENSDVFTAVPGQVRRIDPYVDFSLFYKNIEVARKNGTLPDCLR